MNQALHYLKKNAITASLVFSALLMLISALLMIINKGKIDQTISTQTTAERAKFEIIFSHLDIVRDLDVAIRGYALVREDQLLYIKPDQLKLKMEKVFHRLDSILKVQNYSDQAGLQAVQEYQAYIRMLVSDFGEMSSLLKQGNDSSFMKIFKMDKGNKLGVSMKKAQDKVVGFENDLKEKAVIEYKAATESNIVIGIIMVVMGIPSILLLIIRLRREAKNSALLLKEFELNNRKYVFDPGSELVKDEPGAAVKRSIDHFRIASDFVTHLSKGNFQVVWQGLTPENEALNSDNLAGRLIQLRKDLNTFKEEDEKRIWANEGLTRFSEMVRNHQHNLEELSQEAVKFLVKYLHAQQGGLFVHQEEGDETCLEMSACYAFERRKYIQKKIKIGEGLIGQVYLEGQTLFMKEVPRDYVQITSGLGDAPPRCIVIVPMKYNDKVEAILELASFRVVEKHQIEFLEKAGEFVASALLNSQASRKMQHLLSHSQKQTENMRSAEEELRQNMEEMEATQEEMTRREAEQKQKIQDLMLQHKESTAKFKRLSLVADNTDNSVVITDTHGLIEYVNNGFTKLTGYPLSEVVGKKPGSFLQGPGTSADTVKRISEKLARHEPFYEEILNYDKSGNDYWIALAINPVMENGKLSKYISIQSNVTLTKLQAQEFTAQVEAIGRSNAIIAFDLKGTIQSANKNFLDLMGYTFEEIVSKHHRTFVFDEESRTDEYAQMWKDLSEGTFVSGEFRRKTKAGKEVWLNGTYTAIMDLQGKPYKIMKFAQDITVQKQLAQESQRQNEQLKAIEDKLRLNMEQLTAGREEMERKGIELNGIVTAINSTLANIEFDMKGIILAANDNFLREMGYASEEVIGKHHRIFVEPEYAHSKEYIRFWDDLADGKAQTGEVKRVDKAGNEIWFSASYTPVMNAANIPFKVIKFAQNITRQKQLSLDFEGQMLAIDKSYAVIEFNTDGTIHKANKNFLDLMGYGIEEIRGRHHQIFVEKEETKNAAYQLFWEQLKAGEYVTNEFVRVSKSGKKVKIKGSYSPIKDVHGKVYKIVKYALEIK